MLTLNTQPLSQRAPISHARQAKPNQSGLVLSPSTSLPRFSGNEKKPSLLNRAWAYVTGTKPEDNLKATIFKPHYDDAMAMTLSEDQAKRVAAFGKKSINLTLTEEQSEKIAKFGGNTLIRIGQQVFSTETSNHIAIWGGDTVDKIKLRVLSPEASNEIATWFSDTANQVRIQTLSPEASEQISDWVGDTFEQTRHKVLTQASSEDISDWMSRTANRTLVQTFSPESSQHIVGWVDETTKSIRQKVFDAEASNHIGKFASDTVNTAIDGTKEHITQAILNGTQDFSRSVNGTIRHANRLALQNAEALRKMGYGTGMAATGYYILPYVTTPLKSNTVTIGGIGLMGLGARELKANLGKRTDRTNASAIALSTAAKEGDVDKLEHLIKNKVHINELDPDDCSALYKAAEYGQDKAVQFLIDHGADLQQKSTDLKRTPLWIAAQNGHIGVVHSLLNAHAAIDQRDNNGITPFQIAKAFGNESIARSLRSAGAITSPFSMASQQTTESKSLTSPLDRSPAKVDKLSLAAKENNLPKLKEMLQEGIDYNGLDSDGCTPLYKAAQAGSKETLEFLLSVGADKDLGLPEEEQTPLWIAASNGHANVIQLLLKAQANVNQPDSTDHWTPLKAAVHENHNDIAQTLIQHGANPNIAEKNFNQTPLWDAVSNGNEELVQTLLNGKADPDIAESQNNQTPLWTAAYLGHSKIVKALLNTGANVGITDKENWSPLRAAIEKRHDGIANDLISSGAQYQLPANSHHTSALWWALSKQRQTIAQALIRANADLDTANDNGETPLNWAVSNGHLKLTQALLNAGADPNIPDNDDWTPLYWAAFHNRTDLTKSLLSAGANPTPPLCYNETPLQYARKKGYKKIIKLLTEAGATE